MREINYKWKIKIMQIVSEFVNYNQSMRHFVQYHNIERFGPVGENIEGELFAVMTRKRLQGLPGSRIWAFSGAGKPRAYFVYEVFATDWVLPVANPDFTYMIAGLKGMRFEPFLRVSGYPWFEQMRRSLANFSLGLTEITESYANYLVELAKAESEGYRRVFGPE